jgi:hypothetical protein
MAEINLTQTEADALIAMEKYCLDDRVWDYPGLGGAIAVPLVAPDKKENFFLDITRSRISLAKGTYQNRGRHVVVLARLDFGGPPHRNPDDSEVPCPHLHLYREGYGDKWAYPAPTDSFANLGDLWQTLEDFMRYCNITRPPIIQQALWL